MSAKRRLLIACTLVIAIYHFPAYSSLEYKRAFDSVNTGYANRNSGLIDTYHGEIWEVTADFGVSFKEAEFYSFHRNNVLNHVVAGRNHTVSTVMHIRLFDSDVTFFGKIYGQWDDSWGNDLDIFYGLGYLGWDGEWGSFKPYIRLHDQPDDYISARYGQANGWNDYVVSWTAVLPSMLSDEKFVLSSWNEIELGRNDVYVEQRLGQNGLNGGLTIVWKLYPRWKVNVAWRYLDNKLGYDGFGDQMIYMFGYDF